jgi:hypothetical protein
MKRLIAVSMVLLLFTGFTFKDSRVPKYTTKGDYVYNLIKTSEIQIYFIRAPKISEYFGDIKESDYYAGAFINAAVSGILSFPQKRIYPNRWINVANAKLLMDKAYAYKTGQNVKISGVVFRELLSMKKYKKVRDNYYVTSEMQKDIFAIYGKKIAEFQKSKESPVKGTQEINTSTRVENDQLLITLDWGEKPTSGYEIKIAATKETVDTIEVMYTLKAPLPGDITAQIVTHPKDSIRINVSDIKKSYKILPRLVTESYPDGITVETTREGEYAVVTLNWGEKPTGGYSIKITEAKQVGDSIEIRYTTKSPAPEDMVTQALTYPKDTVKVKVDNPDKEYKIVLIKDVN